LGPQKTQGVFWGATRPRNEKPGAVSRAGLGHTPEGYLFMHESRLNVQKSQVEVTSCTTHGLYSASQEVFVGHPTVGVRPMKNPARGHTFQACSFVLESRCNAYSPEVVNFLVFSTKGASSLPI
jgi:hypothetical protein